MNYNDNHFSVRETSYNSCVCGSKKSVDTMTANFDNAFDFATNFTTELSSVRMYPFDIINSDYDDYGNTGSIYSLLTSKDLVVGLVKNFYRLDNSNSYLNFGQFKVTPYYNNFADYKGYTHIQLFLPFVGLVDIDTNLCMDKWLQFRLLVDYYTGKGIFIVGISDIGSETYMSRIPNATFDNENMKILSTYECNVGIDIPLGTSNAGDIIRNITMGTIKTIATAGASSMAITDAPTVRTTTSKYSPTVKTYDIKGRGKYKGARLKPIKTGQEITQQGSRTTTSIQHTPVNKYKPISDAIDSSLNSLNGVSGNGSSDRPDVPGLMWDITMQVIVYIYRPKFVEQPSDYGNLYGYPLGEVKRLGDLTGYTEISSIHIEGLGFNTAIQSEISMLEEAFENGIIL